jgi:hypothetical protein
VPIDSPQWNLFNDMRSNCVTTFVREFQAAVHRKGKNVRIGGFSDTDTPFEARACGRNCPEWASEGLIDDYFLATYNVKIDEMAAIVENVRKLSGPKVKLYSALTPFNHFLTTNDEMIAASKELLSGGANGLWVYRSDYLESANLWEGAAAAARLLPQRR